MPDTLSTTPSFSAVDFTIAYEGGSLSESEVIEGFQELINSGLAWQLQGAYGRMATALIDAGHCSRPPSSAKSAPLVGEVRTGGPDTKFLPDIGPFHRVSRDTVRKVGAQQFRLVVYGAYNANGLIGSESNGVAVLLEDPPSVVADELGREGTGYYGASRAQLALFEKLCSCTESEFRDEVNKSTRLRFSI